MTKEFDKSEEDLKALQSGVGQIVGEVLRQLTEDKCKSHSVLCRGGILVGLLFCLHSYREGIKRTSIRRWLQKTGIYIYMYGTSQQLGSEVERQGKAHKSTTCSIETNIKLLQFAWSMEKNCMSQQLGSEVERRGKHVHYMYMYVCMYVCIQLLVH